MLSPRHIIFIAVDGLLKRDSAALGDTVSEAFETLARRGIPLVLASRETRAYLEPLRRKLQHGHPFLTESGAGLFIPDGYFNLHLDGATRSGRNFCVPFARSHSQAATALLEIAKEAGASVVGFSQMTIREIARNSGLSTRDAERCGQREFGEVFFFAGETETVTRRFSQIAHQKGWEAVPGDPLWVLRGRARQNGENAVRYLMSVYRKSLHGRQRAVGVGSDAEDLYLLSATDTAIILPCHSRQFDDTLLAKLPQAVKAEQAGPEGWAQAVLHALGRP